MQSSGKGSKTALLVVLSNVSTDPRVRRQIAWLTTEGWTVDTLGLGPTPDAPIRSHFRMAQRSRFSRSGPVLGVTHLLPYRTRFHALSRRLFPQEAIKRVRSQEYDLILFNDTHLLPWLTDS